MREMTEQDASQYLADHTRWTFALTINTNRPSPCSYLVNKVHMRTEEKLLRHPQTRPIQDRLVWLLWPAVTPEDGLYHYHGLVAVPDNTKNLKARFLIKVAEVTKKLIKGSSVVTSLITDQSEWTRYATTAQRSKAGLEASPNCKVILLP